MNHRGVLALVFTVVAFTGPAEAQELAATDTASDAAPKSEPVTTGDPDVPIDELRVLVKPMSKSELEIEAGAWFDLLRIKAGQLAEARLGVRRTNEALAAEDDRVAESSLSDAEAVRESVDAAVIESAEGDQTPSAEDASDTVGSTAEQGSADDSNSEDNGNATSSESGDVPVTEQAEALKAEFLEDVNALQDERTALSDRLEVVLDSLEGKGGDVEELRLYVTAVSGVELDTSDASAAWSGIVGWLTSKEGGQRWAWNLVTFVLILMGTYFFAKIVASAVNWLLERKVHLTQLAERLISSTITNLIMLIGFAISLTALEIDITPILAAIGATGLVVGLALQGTLSNFASGLMILINRPFDVGDVVTAGGVTGTVNQMNLVSTTFRTFDNQTIHVPNNAIWNNVITNITANDKRRVDLEFGIGYDDDFEQAENIIREIVVEHALVLDDPEPVVVTHALADSSVNIVCRPWANTGDWWQVKTDITREVKRRFDRAGISIPYPQQDVHFHKVDSPV